MALLVPFPVVDNLFALHSLSFSLHYSPSFCKRRGRFQGGTVDGWPEEPSPCFCKRGGRLRGGTLQSLQECTWGCARKTPTSEDPT